MKLCGQEPKYHFVNFKDGIQTYACLAGLTLGACGFYFVLCVLDGYMKPGLGVLKTVDGLPDSVRAKLNSIKLKKK